MKKETNEITLRLANGKVITFNDEQTEAVTKINKWLRNHKGGNYFTLSGAAGTGKSTIVKKILNDYRGGVCVSATTHKAKKVIANMTGQDAKTLSSLVGLRPDVDLTEFNPNNPIFNPIAAPRINQYNFVIVDESSMLNSDICDLIFELIDGHRTKVLFIGDEHQLPPVKEKMSKVFTDSRIELFKLNKVERQLDTNPLLLVCDTLRNNQDIDNGGILNKTNLNAFGDGIEYTIDFEYFRKMLIDKFSSPEFKKDSDYFKGLAWRNSTILKSNKLIRNILLGENSAVVEVNDILFGYRTITDAMQSVIIQNSADYHVTHRSSLYENNHGIMGYKVSLKEDLANGEYSYKKIFIVDSSDINNLNKFARIHDSLRDSAKNDKKLWGNYYEFRRENILLVDITKYDDGRSRSDWDVIKKDMDYGYFISVHKSQGSTYKYVAILEKDLNLNWNIIERNKLKYVAFSRASNTCYVYSSKIDK